MRWCGRGDLNPHAFRRHPLKMVCLPVPPLPLEHCHSTCSAEIFLYVWDGNRLVRLPGVETPGCYRPSLRDRCSHFRIRPELFCFGFECIDDSAAFANGEYLIGFHLGESFDFCVVGHFTSITSTVCALPKPK